MGHTPGPWHYGGPVHRDSPGVKMFPSMPAAYWEIGLPGFDIAPAIACAGHEEDARFIVQACNSHEELLAALELALRYLEHPDVLAITQKMALPGSVVVDRSRATIAKAKEGVTNG